jgi:shikimate dehydrogenase
MAERRKLIRLALFGRPVRHSLSPRIHGLFAQQVGIDLDYQAIESSARSLERDLQRLALAGGRGCNITVPLKHRACELATSLSARARQAQAVNTLRFDSHEDWFGDNTDGSGLICDLSDNLGVPVQGRRLLLIGAGGAAAGILFDLLQQQPVQLVLANRTAQRAEDLASRFSSIGSVQAASFGDMERLAPFDLVINATSAGHVGQLPPISEALFAPAAICYDLNYGRAHRVLAQWCAERGISHHDGLGMLVEQAAESFRLWTGRRPDTRPIIEELSSD